VASIERTAYPRFKRVISARELEESFTPTQEEIAWAQGMTRSAPHLLALVLTLRTFQRLGYFAPPGEIPTVVVEHIRRSLRLADDVAAAPESPQTLRHHRSLVRERLGVVTDAEYARKLAQSAIEAAAQMKDNPADLINVALEEIVRARCGIPGYTTLDEMASRIRAHVNGGFFSGIVGRMTDAQPRTAPPGSTRRRGAAASTPSSSRRGPRRSPSSRRTSPTWRGPTPWGRLSGGWRVSPRRRSRTSQARLG
jgi:hypothetical protein